MDKLALIPMIVSAVLLLKVGFGKTFVYWWMPVMVMVPMYFTMDGPLIPPLNFYQTGFLPFLFRKEILQSITRDRHWMDVFPFAFLLIMSASEFFTTSMNSGRQVFILGILAYVGPYFAMKYVILHERLEFKAALVFLGLLAVIGFSTLHEFRFGVNQFVNLRAYWPSHYGSFIIAQPPRWGWIRAAGPFVHPIVAGTIFGFALPLSLWAATYRKIKPMYLALGVIAMCIAGIALTLSRGPMIGAFIGVALFLLGHSRYRVQLFATGAVIFMFLSVPLGLSISDYLTTDRADATSESHLTAIYRMELIENYIDVIKERPLLGHGFQDLPVIGGQTSIDNEYILLALRWGIFATISILLMGLGSCVLLLRTGFRREIPDDLRALSWCLLGGLSACMLSITTVYMPNPANTIYFLWAAWAVAFRLRVRAGTLSEETNPEQAEVEETPPRMVII